jgi:hypothetical protein
MQRDKTHSQLARYNSHVLSINAEALIQKINEASLTIGEIE